MPHRHRLPIIALAAFLLLGTGGAFRAAAQTGQGTIEGNARGAEGETPLAFSVVRLLSAKPDAAPPMGTITDAEGGFRFEKIPPGDYRLQLELIGYQRTLSPILHVAPGASLRHDIRSEMEAIALEGITVHAGGTCLTADRLGEEPALAALWEEARKGVDVRRAFERQYRFTRYVRQDGHLKRRILGRMALQREDTIISEPDSVIARDRRHQEEHRAKGYLDQGRTTFNLRLPNEKELFEDEFLTDHCLEVSTEANEGAIGVRFRPVQPRRDRTDIRGTIWLEPDTYRIRRLDFDYVKGKQTLAKSSVEYTDVTVGGSTVRLPTDGQASGRPSGLLGAAIPEISAKLTISYRDFERVGSE